MSNPMKLTPEQIATGRKLLKRVFAASAALISAEEAYDNWLPHGMQPHEVVRQLNTRGAK